MNYILFALCVAFLVASGYCQHGPNPTPVPSPVSIPVGNLERLVAKEQVMELHYFYNGNMDAAAAVRSTRGPNDPEFLQRVSNIVGIFCPDPEFQGWTATGGVNGDVLLYAPHRDTPAALNYSDYSVAAIYKYLLPGNLFANSSQHMVGMPIIKIEYRTDGRLYAVVNATLRQSLNQFNPVTPNVAPFITEIMGHYYNEFVYYADSFWCMRTFREYNSFSYQFVNINNVYVLNTQNSNNAQLTDSVRPL